MSQEYVVRRASLLHPGPVLGRVRAPDLESAKLKAAEQFRGLLVSVTPLSSDTRALEKATRRALQSPRIPYEPRSES